MASSTNSPKNDLMTTLRSFVPPSLFEAVQRKFNTLFADNAILQKQLNEKNREYGDMVLLEGDKLLELNELREKVELLKAENMLLVENNVAAKKEVERLSKDYKIVQKQLKEAKREYCEVILRDSDNKVEVVVLRAENESLIKQVSELETKGEAMETLVKALEEDNKELMGNWKAAEVEAEVARKERDASVKKNDKLRGKYEAVFDAACVRFRVFDTRVKDLEDVVAKLKAALLSSGEQISISHGKETLENLGSEENLGRIRETKSASAANPCVDHSASALPSRQGVTMAHVKESIGSNVKPEGLVKCNTMRKDMVSFEEKTASSKQVTNKHSSQSSASLPICISDSDDDNGEAKGLKRKLDFNDASFNRRST